MNDTQQGQGGGRLRRRVAGLLIAVGALGACLLVAGVLVIARGPEAGVVSQNGSPTLTTTPTPPGTLTVSAQALPTAPATPRGTVVAPGATPAASAAPGATPQFRYNQPPPAALPALVSTEPLLPNNLGQAATSLTDAIEALNAAEWSFTQAAAKGGGAGLDDELRALAARALVTARLAQKIAESTRNQGVPQPVLDEYNAIARLGYALVIESQNVRTDLAAQAVTPAGGAQRVGSLAAHLLTPRLFALAGQDNPFAAFLPAGSLPAGRPLTQDSYDKFLADVKTKTQFDPAPLQWLSSSAERFQIALSFRTPPASVSIDLGAPGVPVTLMSAGGEANADLARLYAGAQLIKLGATSKTARAGGLAYPQADGVIELASDGPAVIAAWSQGDIQQVVQRGNKVLNNSSFVTWGPDAIGGAAGLDPKGLPVQTAITVFTSTQVKAVGAVTQLVVDKLAKIHSAGIGINITAPTTDDSIALNAAVVDGLGKAIPPDHTDWIVDGVEYLNKKGALALGQMPAGAHYVTANVDLGSEGKAYAGTFFSVSQKSVPEGAFATSLAGGGSTLHEGDTVTFVAASGNKPADAQIAYEWYADGVKRGESGNTISYVPSGPGIHWVSVTAVDTNSGARATTVGSTFEVLAASVDSIGTATAQAAALQTAAAQQTALAQLNADATATAVERAYQAAVQTATAQAVRAALSAAQTATAQALAAKPVVPPPFVPVVVDTFFAPGDKFSAAGKVALDPAHRYQVCFAGVVNLINPTHAAPASDLMHVFGVKVSGSQCVVLVGGGGVTVVTCGSGTVDDKKPGGYSITVTDLGPK